MAKSTPESADAFHYDPETRILSIEDPKLIYYLKHLIWNKFAKQVGYLATTFKAKYDFALSFTLQVPTGTWPKATKNCVGRI